VLLAGGELAGPTQLEAGGLYGIDELALDTKNSATVGMAATVAVAMTVVLSSRLRQPS
jgi:hypothetical protein